MVKVLKISDALKPKTPKAMSPILSTRRHRQAAAAVLVAAVVVLVVLTPRRAPATGRVALESAILPPRAFRRWFYQKTRVTRGPNNEIPLDRFAGRARGRRTAAKVPGYLDQEAKEAREKYMQTYEGLEPQIKELDDEMRSTATWDHGHGDGRSADGKDKEQADLEAKRKALDQEIADAKQAWRKVQDKVDRANKELVNGRARKYNKDQYLGGADHFVTVGDAHKQLAGAGYGHRYSIVDWLSGDRR